MKNMWMFCLIFFRLTTLGNSVGDGGGDINPIISLPSPVRTSDGSLLVQKLSFYKLTFLWPASFCLANPCNRPPTDRFQLHGFWAFDSNWDIIHSCVGAPIFEKERLTDLLEDLAVCWPGFVKENDKFWEDEWIKHGTCSNMGGVHDYFDFGLNACNRYYDRLKTSLAADGIVPHQANLYNLKRVSDAIKDSLGGIYPEITCTRSQEWMEWRVRILYEVSVCFRADHIPRSCPPFGLYHDCGVLPYSTSIGFPVPILPPN